APRPVPLARWPVSNLDDVVQRVRALVRRSRDRRSTASPSATLFGTCHAFSVGTPALGAHVATGGGIDLHKPAGGGPAATHVRSRRQTRTRAGAPRGRQCTTPFACRTCIDRGPAPGVSGAGVPQASWHCA